MPTKKQSDPTYQLRANSIKRYGCLICGKEWVSYEAGAPLCDVCQKYSVLKSVIPESEVLAIKNTVKGPEVERMKKGRAGRFAEGLVMQGVEGTVYPRVGSIPLKVSVNMDADAFVRGAVYLTWGEAKVLTSITELDASFEPLNANPRVVTVPGGAPIIDVPKRTKASFRIGSIEVTGGKSQASFEAMVASFRYKDQSSDFCLSDICSVLAKAL